MRIASCLLALVAATVLTGCGRPRAAGAPVALAPVSPAAVPSLPAFIERLRPRGTTDPLAHVSIRFRRALIPLAALETPAETEALRHFRIEPDLPGHFRFLTPRLIGFQADAAIPIATRVRVTVTAGLKDVTGAALAADVTWSFETASIALKNVPGAGGGAIEPSPLDPKIAVSSNTELDPVSLAAHAELVSGDGKETVPLTIPATPVPSSTPSTSPVEDFDASQRAYTYTLVPAHALAKATTYDIVIERGVMPAHGNLATQATVTGRLVTFGPLRYAGVSAAGAGDESNPGRFSAGSPVVLFTNPIVEASARRAITLSPAPADATHLVSVDGSRVSINPALLEPNTTYTIALDALLADTFGQTLGGATTATFRTGDLAPDVWAPSGKVIFPATRGLALNIISTNLAQANATFKRVLPADLARNDVPDPQTSGGLLPEPDRWPVFPLGGTPNREQTTPISLRDKLGAPTGVLAYGIRGRVGTMHDEKGQSVPRYETYAGLVGLTNLGIFAQYFPTTGMVHVHHLADGLPVAGATVDVLASQLFADSKHQTPVAICAHATTGVDGIATFDRASFARCAALDSGKGDAPAWLTVVRDRADWSYVRSDDSTAYRANMYNGWSSGQPESRGTIFSDRELYQPGETAQFTGVGWFLIDGVLARGRAPLYTLTLESPNGEKRDIGRATLNAYGTFSTPVTIPRTAALGYWTIRASAGTGEMLAGSFRVAEFKPPNFKVDLTLDKTVALRGETVVASAQSAYLFGAPVEAAKSVFDVTRSPADLAPPHWDEYVFGRHWYWPEQQPDAATDVLQAQTRVDGSGNSRQTVRIADDLPYPMTYEVDAQTTDVSNLAVADTKTFTALPSRTLIGLKTDVVGTAGVPLRVRTIATDPLGIALPGVHVKLELQRASYGEATAVIEGAETPETAVTYTTVASAQITTGRDAVVTALTPAQAGTYRVRANVADAADEAAATDTQLWVAGDGDVAWNQPDPNQLTIRLDKPMYKIGDTATALIESPFAASDVYVAVVRHGVLWSQRVHVTGAAPVVHFRVTAAMLPNAAFEALIVRRGAPPAKATADGANAFSRMGFAAFDVALDGKNVRVTVAAEHATLKPGGVQRVRLHVVDRAGHPVQAQLTVIAANDAVLRLSGYRPPDLVKLVYAMQPIATRYGDNRADVVLESPRQALDKGFGYGGGLSAGAEDTRVRRAFSPLAYFAGALVTDAHGNADASFHLPDDLTTWRVMAVAATRDGRFGNGETSFISTQPLLANPVVPQFVRPGDRFMAGVAVTNTTKVRGTLDIVGTLRGPLAFLGDDAAIRSDLAFHAPADVLTQAYRFPMLATGSGTATATFHVAVGTTADAFAIPVLAIDRATTESVIQTGTTQGTAHVALAVAANTPRDAGGLEILLASSVLPGILVTANQVFGDDLELAESAASRLSIAADLLHLGAHGMATPGVKAADQAKTALVTLANLQRADGGFRAYPGAATSDPFSSTVVLRALGRAASAGVRVDPAALGRAKLFVAGVLADPGAWTWCRSVTCKAALRLHALDALAAAGDRRTSYLGDILAVRASLNLADQIRLARLLVNAPGYSADAAALAASIGDRILVSGATAGVTLPEPYAWTGTATVAQAEALRLFLARNAPAEQTDNLARSLLALRRNGTWGCACESAAALTALTEFTLHDPVVANFTAVVQVNGHQVTSERFIGGRAPQRTFALPPSALAAGDIPIAIERHGSGTLHYAVTYTYRVAGAQPGVLAGLRVTREIRPANTATVLATMGLTASKDGVTFPAATVYDVGLQIVTDHAVDRVAIEDPLPAGMEAVDTSFATTSPHAAAQGESWQIGYQRIHHDRIEAYADRLGPGVYVMHYLVRTVTPGTYAWPGAQARLVDRPEEFGRSASTTLTVK